jgi:hypothetical protein
MKKYKLRYFLTPIVLLLVFTLPFINFNLYKIKGYTNDLEKINYLILKDSLINKDILDYIINQKKEFPFVLKVVQESELCLINHYPEKGIVYQFRCNNHDDKFYLIKTLNKNKDLLSYEQFIDNSKSPIKLGDDWYLIQQNVVEN